MPSPLELLTAVCLLLGTFLMMVAALGLLRLPDVFCRMHAAGKAGTLGVVLIILGTAAIFFGTPNDVSIRGPLAIVFQFLTSPAATHLLARAAYVREYPLSDRTKVDELKTFLPSRPDEIYTQE
ncbi:MAG: Na+/H+ antiporter subunit G [Zetaproteobacteria bacterium]|nr:MAG: Na+/H+ antiporter subunit G [Zetaproteobacteria bacterium]